MHKDVILKTSTKQDGNLAFKYGNEKDVSKNRKEFVGTIENLAIIQVVHGENIVYVDSPSTHTCEALITKTKDLTLFLLTGDCLPIAFYDPVLKVAALAHLGWKPTDLKLSQKVVKEMKSDPNDILVDIGPGIHKESYIKTEPDQLSDPLWEPYLEKQSDGQFSIDLYQYNIDQLVEVGLSPKNITVSDIDTGSNQNYFSHYRSMQTGEPEGRMATILTVK